MEQREGGNIDRPSAMSGEGSAVTTAENDAPAPASLPHIVSEAGPVIDQSTGEREDKGRKAKSNNGGGLKRKRGETVGANEMLSDNEEASLEKSS